MMRFQWARWRRSTVAWALGAVSGLAVDQVSAEGLPVADLPKDRQVDYASDIEPVLKKNCVACHNQSTDEAGVNLESPQAMKAAADEGVLVPGKPEESRMFLLASHAEEPVMPPEDNDVEAKPFSPMELALLKRWIEAGAPYQDSAPDASAAPIQPLPPTVQTVYASAMTADAKVTAVAFGNRVELFTRQSSAPLESLTRSVDGKPQPAHDDFVQDLEFSSDGETLVSSGYRNVKIWQRQSTAPVSLPAIDADDVVAASVNRTATHVATLSPRGEVAVASLGKQRWDWMKGFDLPQSPANSNADAFQLSVGPSGQTVAIANGQSLWLVRNDSADVASVPCDSAIRSLAIGDDKVVYSGHESGVIMRHRWEDARWTATEFTTEGSPVQDLAVDGAGGNTIVAVNDAGHLWRFDAKMEAFKDSGALPSAAAGITLMAGQVWVTTTDGVLGRFDLDAKQFAEVASSDPVAARQHRRDQWQSVVAKRIQSATEAELKAAQDNAKAEQDSLDKITKEIESKQKALSETDAALKNAKTESEQKAKALADAKAEQQQSNQQRAELAEALKQLDGSIEQLEKQLQELKKQKQDAETKLAAIPEEKALAEAVKKADEAADKAAAEAKKKQDEHDAMTEAIQLAKASKQRGEQRFESLNQEVETRQQAVERAKAEAAAVAEREKQSKALMDKAKAASGAPTPIAGKLLMTENGGTSGVSLWAADGTWLGAIDAVVKPVAAGGGVLLTRGVDGTLTAVRVSPRLWRLQQQIGSVTGESPFGDRVLCVAVDPNGRYLATGGGLPSRTGELMLWNLRDGTLVRRFDDPHQDTVLAIRFSPDGKTLASGGADRMVHLWDVESGKRNMTLEGHTHHVTAVAWDLDGREVSSGAADGVVKVWDLKTGKASRTISGIKSEVTRLVYLGSDGRIGITSGDGYLSVYRTDNGRRETYVKIPAGYLYALDRNREGSELIVGGADGTAVLVDKSGKTLQSYGRNP